jgi:hypothetical protein
MNSCHIYNVYKATEGGLGQKYALQRLKDAGIKAVGCTSCYVGQTAVMVHTDNKRTLARVSNLLYGRV